MKKLIIYFLLIFSFFNLYSQGKEIVLGSKNSSPEYLAGSLPVNFSGNFHKLKIEIFGGNYHNGNLGENHYYISTRDGLKINQEIHGGSYEKYTLKVYDNGNGYDFVIKVTGDWPSFLVRSWTIDSSKNPQENTITDYNPKAKTDITNTVKVNTIFATNNDGNIGIGTTDTKGYKLAVAGKAIAEEVTIKLQSTWPDFVFDKNYTLPTLQEVEEHINQKGHLANIPSAKEVKENGIKVGEMHKKLLQKIEELTLYTIQQQKEIKKLNNENKQLKKLEERIKKLEKNL